MCPESPYQKYSILDLLQNTGPNGYDVCIPIIQRDYAHGRTDPKARAVRENLLSAIVEGLASGSGKDFNFVYGPVSGNGVFYPVDGQPRRTTLYLIGWYLAVRSGGDILEDFLRLRNFRYETRSSADEFFRQLRQEEKVKEGGELHKIVNGLAKEKTGGLKDALQNSTWFRHNWLNDPTVQSALTVLDELHQRLKDSQDPGGLYNNLKHITFQLNMETNRENAEAKAAKNYLRMNARGKPLNDFENLKAMLDSIDKELDAPYNLAYNYDTVYIDTLFKAEQDTTDLAKKTEHISSKSLRFFKNLYKLCWKVFRNGDGREKLFAIEKLSDSGFVIEIHAVSRKNKLEENEQEFFKKYFQMLVRVLDLYCFWKHDGTDKMCGETKKILDSLFTELCNRDAAAPVVLCAMHQNAINRQNAEQVTAECGRMHYIVKNLEDVIKGDRRLEIINGLAEKSSGTGIFPYFAETPEETLYAITQCGADPSTEEAKKAIVYEQKLKAQIILGHKNDEYYWFSELEDRANSRRRVQYLFYLSGYYSKSGNFTKLKGYFAAADTYFHDNKLLWKKLWATACYADKGVLPLPAAGIDETKAKEIDEKCAEYEPWEDKFYYWDSPGEPPEKDTAHIERIRLIYDNLDAFNKLRKVITDGEDCWLKFALLYNEEALLNHKLQYSDQEGEVQAFVPEQTGWASVADLSKYRWNGKDLSGCANGSTMSFAVAQKMCSLTNDKKNSQKKFEFGLKPFLEGSKPAYFSYDSSESPTHEPLTVRLTLDFSISIEGLPADKCICVYESNDPGTATVYYKTGKYTFYAKELDFRKEKETRQSLFDAFGKIEKTCSADVKKQYGQKCISLSVPPKSAPSVFIPPKPLNSLLPVSLDPSRPAYTFSFNKTRLPYYKCTANISKKA